MILGGWWLEYASANADDQGNSPLFWNAAKVVLRGKIMSYLASYKRKLKVSYEEASSKLRATYTEFRTHPSPQNRTLWQTAKHEFRLWAD